MTAITLNMPFFTDTEHEEYDLVEILGHPALFNNGRFTDDIDMLSADERFHLITTTPDAFEADKLCNTGIDLILMDVQTLHKHSGLAAGIRIKASWPNIKVIIVTSLIDPEVLSRAKAGGIDSLWYKDHGKRELMEVIERTLAGERVFPDTAPVVELEEMSSDSISPTQLEMLRCLIRGMTYKEVGEKFNISDEGVRWNIKDMVRRGGFSKREDLYAAVIDNKLIVTSLKDQ